MEILKVKRLSPKAILPKRATDYSAGYDLSACIGKEMVIPARGRALVPTGIAAELEPGYAGLVFGRSGLGLRFGLVPANAVGVIDSDYRGEIVVGLANHSDADYTVSPGERIAQLVIVPVMRPEVIECEELSETPRGTGGIGSTGRYSRSI